MLLKCLKIFKRVFTICFETLAIILGFVVLLGGILVWQLTQNGINVTFSKNYIQDRLSVVSEDLQVDIQKAILRWPDIKKPFVLDLNDVAISSEQDNLVSVNRVQIGIYARSLLLGAIRPSSIMLDNVDLRLIRDEEGRISFDALGSLSSDDYQPAENKQGLQLLELSEDGQNSLSRHLDSFIAGESTEDGMKYFKFVTKLETFEITNSILNIDDRQLNNSWILEPFSMHLKRSERGLVLKTSIEGGDVLSDRAKINSEISYDKQAKTFDLLVDVYHFDPMDLAQHFGGLQGFEKNKLRVSAQASAKLANDLRLMNAAFSTSLQDGRIWMEGVYDRHLNLNDMFIQGRYDPANNSLIIDDSFLKLEGVRANLETVFPLNLLNPTHENRYDIPVNLEIPRLEQTQIKPLWPSVLDGEGSKIWATQRFSRGYFDNIEISMPLAVNVKANPSQDEMPEDEFLMEMEFLDSDVHFDIHNMNIDYREPLEPIKRASGRGHFSSKTDELVLTIDEALIFDVAATGGEAKLTNIVAGDGHAYIYVDLEGPLPSLFKYIAEEPISIDDEILGFDVDTVRGIANVRADITFPAVKEVTAEEVKVSVSGTLSDLLLPKVVKGLDVSGGPYKVKAADGAIQVSGSGFLSNRPITFDYIQNLELEGKKFSSKVSAEFISDAELRNDLGVNLEEYVSGKVPVDIEFTRYNEDKAEILFNADIREAVLDVADFNYKKPSNSPGRANGSIVIEGEYIKEVRDISISADDFYIDNGRLLFKVKNNESDIYKGNLPVLRVHETNCAAEFEYDDADTLRVQVTGEFFDARPFMGGEKEKNKPMNTEDERSNAVMASVDVDRMRTSDSQMVSDAKLYLDIDKVGDIRQFELDAVAGKGTVYLRLKPGDDGRMTLRLETDDAGSMLRAFDTYEKMRSGKFTLYAESKSVETNYELHGHVQIRDFKVIDAPILGRILSLAGPAAIPSVLQNDGMHFSRLESDFSWRRVNSKDSYFFKNGKASAASLRLTFDGIVDEVKDRWDLSGTIVPLSAINSLISNIPIVGDILAGGKDGAVIAATYSVKGAASDPKVSVNPLAVLAPGILRKLIFEDEHDDGDSDSSAESEKPKGQTND